MNGKPLSWLYQKRMAKRSQLSPSHPCHVGLDNMVAINSDINKLVGIVTGMINPGVMMRVYMGLGYGLEILNPTQTRTPIAIGRVQPKIRRSFKLS